MDNLNNIQETQMYQKQIKELFKELVSEEIYDTWADSFEIEIVDEKRIFVIYHGEQDIKKFKKECKGILVPCIRSILGDENKIKISGKGGYTTLDFKTKKNIKAVKFFVLGMIFICIATLVVVVMCNYIGNRNFREIFYNVSSIKADSRLRVVQVSDLHNSSFGKDNKKLLTRIEELNPDIIICSGDIVNSAKDDIAFAKNLAKGLSEIAPSYYIYGNNEVETIYDINLTEKELDKKFGFDQTNRDESALLSIEDSFEKELEETGIKVLKNEKDTLKIRTMTVDVYGVLNSNPSSFWSYSGQRFDSYINQDTDNLKITAVHEPFIFEEFQPEFWGDLAVCGHSHGGLIRVPILGPLYTHEGGLFPGRSGKFVYGRYDTSGTPLVVSAGLDNSNVFRINNEPELVIIDINKF
jgi:predicted MPP superfamily phosphohydrolase